MPPPRKLTIEERRELAEAMQALAPVDPALLAGLAEFTRKAQQQ